MSEPTTIVHIVDDDPSFLVAVARMLRASGFVVKTFASAAEFLAQPELDVPGCVLTDLQMPRVSGLDLQEALAKAGHRIPVVFLTGRGDIPASVHAMRHGADDFLTNRAPKQKLRARFEVLTEREREVLQHVLRGQLNKQIAADLGIHERTVKLHRTAITTKLRVSSVAELTKLWLESGGSDG
jgi:FixJ family two-component response regulator